jgi:serine protease inhibitor
MEPTRREVLGGMALLATAACIPRMAAAAAVEIRHGALSWLPLRAGVNDVVAPWSVFATVELLALGADEHTRRAFIAALELPAADSRALRDVVGRVSTGAPTEGHAAMANVLYMDAQGQIDPVQRAQLIGELRCEIASVRDAKAAIGRALARVGLERDASRGMFEPSDTLGVLNALNVRSTWQHGFDPAATRPRTFLTPSRSVELPFMHRLGTYGALPSPAAVTVALPFIDGSRMLVYVPAALGAFSQTWERETMDALPSLKDETVVLAMPKFEVGRVREFGGALCRAVPLESSARIYGYPTRRLRASHVARVKIDEAGASISAATHIRRPKRATHFPTIDVDRPFGFLLVDASSSVVLVKGRIYDPSLRATA